MLKKIIIIVLGMLVLSGCTDSFRGYFKKSANNKLVDTKGFDGEKRRPLYNKKYISLAKKNVAQDNLDYDDDEYDEDDDNPLNNERINPTKRNREMYLKMIKRDAERKKNKNVEGQEDYVSLNQANKKIEKERNTKQDDSEIVRKELTQIKAMLDETRKELAKYSCSKPFEAQKIATPVSFSEKPKKVSNTKSNPKVKEKFLSSDDDIATKESPSAI